MARRTGSTGRYSGSIFLAHLAGASLGLNNGFPVRQSRSLLLFIGLGLFLLSGCQNSKTVTFAGFTFGGGGNTYSAEPAFIGNDEKVSFLKAGSPQQDVYLNLSWLPSEKLTSPIPLSTADVKVAGKGEASTLSSGHVVIQTVSGPIVHGSFDLVVKASDGREFNIVGSFTATKEPAPGQP